MKEWMEFYENISHDMYLNEYETDLYCAHDYFGSDEESEKKADSINDEYEEFLKKYGIEREEDRFKVALAVKYTDALFEKGREELRRHPNAQGFLGNYFAQEIIARYNARYRMLWDDEDRDFAIDVIRMMIDFVNEDYDHTNKGVVDLFEIKGMTELYARYCDKESALLKEAIRKAGAIDYSFYNDNKMEFDDRFKRYKEVRRELEGIVDKLKAACENEDGFMNKVYCYSKCSTCKKALKWLDSNGVSYEQIDIKEQHPDEATLREYHKKSGLSLKKFFNTSGKIYKDLELSKKLPDMSEDEQFRLLASDGMLVKRPLLISSDRVLAGFKEDEWKDVLL